MPPVLNVIIFNFISNNISNSHCMVFIQTSERKEFLNYSDTVDGTVDFCNNIFNISKYKFCICKAFRYYTWSGLSDYRSIYRALLYSIQAILQG